MEELSAYSQVSNFWINYAKSEVLPVTIPPALATTLRGLFPLPGHPPPMRYLGIQLTDCLDTRYTHNDVPLLKKIRQDLQSWNKVTFTWLGRTNIIKMTILTHIIFLLQMVPVPLPWYFFAELCSLFIKFVWRGKRSRLAMALLQRSKWTLDLGIPDVLQYYQVVALLRVFN